jgi:Disulfide bond formation protein DsbB
MTDPHSRPPLATLAALVAAAVSVAGSLYLSLGMGLIACPLCFYQRAFAFAVFGVLILGVLTRAWQTGYVNLMAFLPAIAGGVVAAFHTYLDGTGRLICPKGILEIGTTAQQSLASYLLIVACLLPGLAADLRRKAITAAGVGVSILLGGAFAYGCIVSSPPPRTPPPEIRHLICYPPSAG